jgi:hypothetical protein
MAVPFTFGSATAAIPLSQLDTNFATTITLGNTAIQLGNTVTTLNNMTLGNVTVSSGNVTITNVTTSGNLTFTGTGNRITGDFSNATTANKVMFQTSTTNGATVINVIPAGSGNSSGFNLFNDSGFTNSARFDIGLLNSGTEARLSSTIVGTGTYVPMTFLTGGGERVRIDTSGNVGIGTSSPSSKLDVRGSATNFDGLRLINTEGSSGAITTTSLRLGITNSIGIRNTKIQAIESTVDSNSVSLAFFVNNANALDSEFEAGRFDSSGNLLVGAVGGYVSERIHARAASATTQCFSGFNPNNGQSATNYYSASVSAASTGWYHLICQAGDGSGVTTNNLYIYGNGNIQNTNNSYCAISDIKLKENVVDATPKLDKLMQVRVVNYNLKGEEGYETHKQIGVIAQELEQIFPGMVEETADKDVKGEDLGTTTKSVKYSVFVPMLIKALQEQQALITSLTDRITALEAK